MNTQNKTIHNKIPNSHYINHILLLPSSKINSLYGDIPSIFNFILTLKKELVCTSSFYFMSPAGIEPATTP